MKLSKIKRVSAHRRPAYRPRLIKKQKYLALALTLLLSLSVLWVLGFNESQENKPTSLQKSEIDESSPVSVADITFTTPYPATEAQKACQVRLEKDRLSGQVPEAVYCGGTGKYIATDSEGNKYIYETNTAPQRTPTEQTTQRVSNSADKDNPQRSTTTSPVCTYEDLPYKTSTIPDSTLKEGLTETVGGVEGYKKVCTNNDGGKTEEIILSPSDKTIYVGTYTYEQALSDARYACRGMAQGSTDMTDCVNDKMEEYGFR